jgi:hypothetical protein
MTNATSSANATPIFDSVAAEPHPFPNVNVYAFTTQERSSREQQQHQVLRAARVVGVGWVGIGEGFGRHLES